MAAACFRLMIVLQRLNRTSRRTSSSHAAAFPENSSQVSLNFSSQQVWMASSNAVTKQLHPGLPISGVGCFRIQTQITLRSLFPFSACQRWPPPPNVHRMDSFGFVVKEETKRSGSRFNLRRTNRFPRSVC